MRILRGVRAATFFLLCLCACAPFSRAAEPWWNNEWKHRYTVVAPRDGRGSMIVEIAAPEARADGADLRVVDERQREFSDWRLLRAAADKKFILEISLPDAAVEPLPTFRIYYGNPNAAAPALTGQWDTPPVRVEMRFFGSGPQPETWDELLIFLDRPAQDGERWLVHQITPEAVLAENPNPRLSVYRANLICPEDGEYTFSLDSTGASFLFIDDVAAVTNDGNPRWGKFKVGASVRLSAGAHRLELLHIGPASGTPLSLGWETPQPDERDYEAPTHFVTVPIAAFVTPFRGRLAAHETLDTPLNPFFTYTQRMAFRVNNADELFVVVQFSDSSVASEKIASRLWNFGDGGTSTASQTTHVFHGAQDRPVTLTLTDKNGRAQSIERNVEWNRVNPQVVKLELHLTGLPPILSSESKLNFSAAVLNPNRRGDMELMFQWRPLSLSASVEKPLSWNRTKFNLQPDRRRVFEIQTDAVGKLSGIEIELRFNDIPVAQKNVRFQKTDAPLGKLQAVGSQLRDERGNAVVLVADDSSGKPMPSQQFSNRIVFLDDALLGNGILMDGGGTYAERLNKIFNERGEKLNLHHVRWVGGSGNIATALYRLSHLDEGAVSARDLVVVSIGLTEIQEQLSLESFERQLRFIVDYLRNVKGANVLLVTPPPPPATSESARLCARKIVQVGLEMNAPVCNLYGLMLMENKWQDFFRENDKTTSVFLEFPNSRGQQWIAEKLARTLLEWKTGAVPRD